MSFTTTYIGEVKTEVVVIPAASGLSRLENFIDSITGQTGARYFNKRFRLSQDKIIFTAWYDLTEENLSLFTFMIDTDYSIELEYTRAGSDNSGNLTFNSITSIDVITVADTCTVGPFAIKNPIFKDIFCGNLVVNEITINLFNKIKGRGILPDYIEREESEEDDYDKDFDEFWMNVCEFLAMLNTHMLYMSQVLTNRELLIKFLINKGLVIQGDENLSHLQYLASKRLEVFFRRGTQLVFKDRGEVLYDGTLNDIRGEFFNLISKKDTDEFIINYVQEKFQGWNLGNSSPLYRGLSDDQLLLNKFYTDSFETLDEQLHIPLTSVQYGSGDAVFITDATRDNKKTLKLSNSIIGPAGFNGIGSDDTSYRILVDSKFNYEIDFWFRCPEDFGSQMYFGVDCYDKDFNLIQTESILDGSDTNTFLITSDPFKNDKWFYMRGIIHPHNALNQPAPDGQLAYCIGSHLRFKPEAKYIIPKFGILDTDPNGVMYISDARVKMSYLPWSLGFLNLKNLIYIFAKDSTNATDTTTSTTTTSTTTTTTTTTTYSYLPLTTAYMTAIGIADDATIYYPSTPQEITGHEMWLALNDYEQSGITDGWLPLRKVILPMIGGTASAHKFNFKNAVDSDSAFRAIFNGGITHSQTGILLNGVDGWVDSNFSPAAEQTLNSASFGLYSRSDLAINATDLFSGDGAGTTDLIMKWGDNNILWCVNNSEVIGGTTADSKGFYQICRNEPDRMTLWKEGVLIHEDLSSSLGMPTENVNIGRNTNGSLYSPREYCFFVAGDGLSDVQLLQEKIAVQALQNALNR